jgi:hypothetical protein
LLFDLAERSNERLIAIFIHAWQLRWCKHNYPISTGPTRGQ